MMAGMSSDDAATGYARNNYVRSEGQNVGNFLTDRASSRVLAPPGGQSSIVFGDDSAPLAPRDNVMYSPSRGPTRLDSFGQQGARPRAPARSRPLTPPLNFCVVCQAHGLHPPQRWPAFEGPAATSV